MAIIYLILFIKFKTFILNKNFVEKNINIQQTLFSSFEKKTSLKIQKFININYLMIELIKMRVLVFLVSSQY